MYFFSKKSITFFPESEKEKYDLSSHARDFLITFGQYFLPSDSRQGLYTFKI